MPLHRMIPSFYRCFHSVRPLGSPVSLSSLPLRSSFSPPFRRVSSSEASTPIPLLLLYLPRLSPSMERGDLLFWHYPELSDVSSNSLVFNLVTSQLLNPAAGAAESKHHKTHSQASEPSEHEMEVESADEGYCLQVLRDGTQPRKEFLIPMEHRTNQQSNTPNSTPQSHSNSADLRVGTLVGFMFEDDPSGQFTSDQLKNIKRKLLSIFDAQPNQPATIANDSPALSIEEKRHFTLDHRRFVTRPFIWQAYVRSGQRQTGSCTPQRNAADEPDGL